MKTLTGITLGLAISVTAMTATATTTLAASKAHAHMGHVSKSWNDTPEKAGLLPTAIAEAKIAAYHASVIGSKIDNLKWIKTHTHHVLHAVGDTAETKGPGKGYGVLKGAAGTAKHIVIAAKQSDASKHVKVHAKHVAASAFNTVDRVKRIIKVGHQILAAKTAKAAAPLVKRMAGITVELQDGRDANGDGKITWEKGEGGLKASVKHMGIMYKLEGI